MKKKSLLIILLMSIGFLIPTGVFAVEVNNYIYNNIDIDYRFFVDEEKDQEGKKKFRLYDNSNILNFESEYNSATHEYLFNIKNENYEPFDDNGGRKFYGNNSSSIDFPAYVRDYNMIAKFKNNLDMEDYILNHRVHGFCMNDEDSYNIESPNCIRTTFSIDDLCNYYDFIPMILEDTISGKKRIVFASFNLYSSFYYYGYMMCKDKSIYNDNQSNAYYAGVYLYNHLNLSDDDLYLLDSVYGLSFENNIKFMRNAMYDYSDELWEELNSVPIASSEMSYDNSDNDLNSPKVITSKTNDNKTIYSKYQSNVNYRFKVKNGNGMNFKLHDISNTFNFSSKYDKDSDTYSIVDNSTDTDYQDGIKKFSKIIVDEVKNGNFSGLADKYKSITSDNCSSDSCDIYTYIPMILEGESNTGYAKQIVLGLMNIQYRGESGKDYYDIGLNVYNNTCDLLESNIDASQNNLINLSRSISEDYSSNLMNQYSDGSISMEDIYEDVDVNTLKDKYCNELPVISLRQNPKTLNNGVLVLVLSLIVVGGSSFVLIRKKHNN